MRFNAAVVMLATGCSASQQYINVLAGPVVGFRLSGPPGDRTVLGFEGGVGWSAERVNLGFEHSAARSLYYLELDPWFIVGASLGLGIEPRETDVAVRPIVGVWEGIPLVLQDPADCLDKPDDPTFYPTVTLSFGYRYTGEHELFFAPKIGGAQKPYLCE